MIYKGNVKKSAQRVEIGLLRIMNLAGYIVSEVGKSSLRLDAHRAAHSYTPMQLRHISHHS